MAQMSVPVIETARLRLRAFEVSDLDALATIYADPAVMRYIRNGVRSREQAMTNILTYASASARTINRQAR